LEFGKAIPAKPSLPPARPGDLTAWSPGSALVPAQRPIIRKSVDERLARRGGKEPDRHELVIGARPHFLKTRKSDVGLLRPFKRLLVDIVVSEKQLEAALEAANALFLALESVGHRVTFAPPDARMRRAEFDEREAPNRSHYHRSQWSPDRITVVYIDKVPIGLTLFETTENIEVVYVHGTYLPVSELSATQLRRYDGPMHWKTKQSRTAGRFCWQAYCPHSMVAWTKQWRAGGGKELLAEVPRLVKELEAAAPVLSKLVAEAETRAQAQRRQWEDEDRRRREDEERARQVRLRAEAKSELLGAIEGWDRARGVQEWFARVERETQNLDDADRQHLVSRLEQAKALIGGMDALDLLRQWKAPGERR
jgi:hypothetical protein